jgi:hypothetical protein
MRLVHRCAASLSTRRPSGDVYEASRAATDPSPFAVARRQAEVATGVAMRDWTGRHLWVRAWHHDLTLIEAGRRGVLPATLVTELARALKNEAARHETERPRSVRSGGANSANVLRSARANRGRRSAR